MTTNNGNNNFMVRMPLSNLQKRILQRLGEEAQTYTLSELAKLLKKDKGNLHRTISSLIKQGLVEKIKLGIIVNYRLTPDGCQLCCYLLTGYERTCRSHNLRYKCKIVRYPKSKSEFLEDSNVWRMVGMKNWKKYLRDLDGGGHLQVTPEYFIFYLPQIFDFSSDGASERAKKIVYGWMKEMMKEYDGLVLGEPERISSIISQHHAILNHPFAKKCRKAGISIITPRHSIDSSKKW